MEQKTRFMDIYRHLSENGVEVYSPAQKEGECTSSYVVVKDAGTTKYTNISSTQTLYDVMCYVPKAHFTELEQFVERVKSIMKGLYPMVVPTYFETASFYDDSVKAHMISIQYRNARKI